MNTIPVKSSQQNIELLLKYYLKKSLQPFLKQEKKRIMVEKYSWKEENERVF